MYKGGLLVILVNLLLKLVVGFGLWRMAMNYRERSSQAIREEVN